MHKSVSVANFRLRGPAHAASFLRCQDVGSAGIVRPGGEAPGERSSTAPKNAVKGHHVLTGVKAWSLSQSLEHCPHLAESLNGLQPLVPCLSSAALAFAVWTSFDLFCELVLLCVETSRFSQQVYVQMLSLLLLFVESTLSQPLPSSYLP
jgi:hypothetical protein